MTIEEALAQTWPSGIATYALRKIEHAVELGTRFRGCSTLE